MKAEEWLRVIGDKVARICRDLEKVKTLARDPSQKQTIWERYNLQLFREIVDMSNSMLEDANTPSEVKPQLRQCLDELMSGTAKIAVETKKDLQERLDKALKGKALKKTLEALLETEKLLYEIERTKEDWLK